MSEEHRTWWGEVADQYEEWSEEPPKCRWLKKEIHTCDALDLSYFGFVETKDGPIFFLSRIWKAQYGPTDFPAGKLCDGNRDDLRFDFCHHMAETIREYLETEQ